MRALSALGGWRGSERAPESRRGLWPGALLVGLAVAALCWPSRAADFEADDFGYVRLLHAQPFGHFLRLGDVSEGLWGRRLDELRPVMALSYKVGSLLHGVDPAGLHTFNILLHVVATLLVVALVLSLMPAARPAALLAGLLFGVAPAHAEAICWITGKVESLAAIFYLGTFVLFLRFRRRGSLAAYAGAVLLYALGVFTKEILITLPVLLVLCDLLLVLGLARARSLSWRDLRLRLLAHAPFFALAALLMVVRALVFGSAARAERVNLDRLLAFLAVQGDKLLLLLAPFPDLRSPERAPGAGPWLATALILAALAAVIAWLAASGREYAATVRTALFLGVVWYALNMAPLIVTYVSARHLYLPSCGLLAALALAIFPVTEAGRTRVSLARFALAAALVLVHAALLLRSEDEWIAAGRRSAAIRSRMQQAALELPAGSVVVLSGVPSETERLMLWRSALPFALQPPFTSLDVYARLRVLAPPVLYGRPADDWWRAQRGVFLELVHGEAGDRLDLHVAQWNPERGELVLRHARPTRGFVRGHLGEAVRRPLESAKTLSEQEAERLIGRLAGATRQAAVRNRARGPGRETEGP